MIHWPQCQDLKDVWKFMRVIVYYCISIQHFLLIASTFYNLFRKNLPFNWNPSYAESIDLLKIALTYPPTLVSLDYLDLAEDIIFSMDASLTGYGGILMQLVSKKKQPSRYESEIWSLKEKKYNSRKNEC